MTDELWTIGDAFDDVATSACGHHFADCDSRKTAQRTADLWNALATIPDPLAFVQAARGMAEALEHLTTFTDDTCRYVDADPLIASAQSALTAFRAATVGEA